MNEVYISITDIYDTDGECNHVYNAISSKEILEEILEWISSKKVQIFSNNIEKVISWTFKNPYDDAFFKIYWHNYLIFLYGDQPQFN